MLVIDAGQAIAIAMLLIACGGLVVAYVNMQTNRLASLVGVLQALLVVKDKEIAGLTARLNILEQENLRLLTELVTHLSKVSVEDARRRNAV